MKTVRDVKERILALENCKDGLNRIQKCITSDNQSDDSEVSKAVRLIEDEAGLYERMEGLCFNTVQYIEKEIHRLKTIIDNAIIQEM